MQSKHEHSTAGIPQMTTDICQFQVKNNCLRYYKKGADHTQ